MYWRLATLLGNFRGALRWLSAPCAWTAFIAVPVAGWTWLDGLPLGPFEVLCVALIWWVWAIDRSALGWRVLLALTAAKVLAGMLLVTPGLSARYYANAEWAAPVERSVDLRSHDITRRDRRIAFGGPAQPDLPVHFFNDLRFNFLQPDRTLLPYSVQWDGFFRHDGPARTRTLYLDAATGVTGELALDGRPVLALDGTGHRSGAIVVAPGWHAITVRMAAPYGSHRRAEAGELVDGVKRPFGGRNVIAAPVSPTRLLADAALWRLAGVADLIVLSWLGWLASRRVVAAWQTMQLGRLLWLGAMVEAVLFAAPYADRVVTLTGTDDPLTYEHMARVIAYGDVLLQQPGSAGGQGAPFYYQAGYPYVLALTHLTFGDALFGAAFVQRLLLAATIGWMAAMTTRLFGGRAGWVALIGGGLFMYEKGGVWTTDLMSEAVFMPLLAGWTWLLVRSATEGASWRHVIAAGLVGGGATLIRSTLLLAWPIVVPAWCASLRRHGLRATAVLLVLMCAVVGTATLRNWIVGRTFVLVSTSGGINLFRDNTPPREFTPPVERARLYDRFQLNPYVAPVVEYAVQAPTEFASHLGRKAVYSVGLFDLSGLRRGLDGMSVWYFGVWCAVLVGAGRLVRSRTLREVTVIALPGLVALSHLIVIALFNPYNAGDRMMLPMYPLLIPYAAMAVEPVAARIWRDRATMMPLLLGALAVCLFTPGVPRADSVVAVLVVAAVIWALTAGPRPVFGRAAWLYGGYGVCVVLTLAGGSSRVEDVRYQLLLPLAAFAVATLARDDRTRSIIVDGIFVGAMGALVVGEMGRMVSASAARLTRMIHVGIAALAAFTWLPPRWPTASMAAAAFGGAAVTLALAWPTTSETGVLVGRNPIAGMTAGWTGIVGALCLAALWMRAAWTTARAAYLGGPRPLAMCHGAVMAGLVLAVGGLFSSTWAIDVPGFPSVALGALFGLADTAVRHS